MLETGRSLPPEATPVDSAAESYAESAPRSGNTAASAWVDRQLNPHRAAAIAAHSGPSFLDVGCGNGRYVLHFEHEYATAGIDIQSYPQWEEAPHRLTRGDAADLPFDDGSFDTVVSFETLEHIPDPEAVLHEFHRVCRRNIILSVPNCELPKSLEASRLTFFHYTDRSHINFFTCDSLDRILRQAGFEPQSIELINACPTQPLLNEVLRLPPFLTRLAGKLVKKDLFQMTVLAVAQKR